MRFVNVWDLEYLSEPEHYFHYAQGFLESSILLFESMQNDTLKLTLGHAKAAYTLVNTAMELFLKGSYFLTKGELHRTHDLSLLYNLYKKSYKGKKFVFNTEIDKFVRKDPCSPFNVGIKYPTDLKGKLWPDTKHFNPDRMVIWLRQLKKDFDRLIPEITGKSI